MGITGLIKFVEDAQKTGNLSSYRGKIVAIDGYIWLHKAISTCVHELAYGIITTKYVTYCMKRIKHLLDYGVIPVIVFDGAPLPIKAVTEMLRRKRREERIKNVIEMHKKKKKVIPRDLLIGCIKVTYEMVNDWIVELRTMGIRYIVAPYEADPQLAYLCKKNIASAAISEDSDLIVFKCNEVLFKLDLDSSFIQIKYDNIFKIPSMKHMTPDKFIEMCILSGCDYLPSPKRVGIKTAYNLLKTMSASELFEQWDLYPDDPKVPERCPDYSVKFYLAKFAFYHQFVYDDETNKVVNLNPIDPNQTLPNGYNIADIIGHMIDPKIAEGVAKGFLNPITHEPFIHNVKIPPQLTFDSFIIPSKPSFNKVLPKNSESLSDNILKTIPLNAVEHFSSSDVSLLNAADISNTNDTTRSQVHTVKSSFFVKLSQLNKINASPINSNSLNTSPINSNSLNTFQSISDPPSNLNSIESIDNSNSRLGDIRSYLSQMKFTEKKVLATESNTSKISYSEQKKINKPSVLRTTKIPFKPKCRYTTSRHSKDNSLNQETYSSDPSTLSLETESKINILSDTNESPVKQFAKFCSRYMEKSSRNSS